MGLIYLDSCIVIYIVEKHPTQFQSVSAAMMAAKGAELAISPLVRLECLVGPLRRADGMVEANFERFFDTVTMLEMPAAIYRDAARLRALHGLKTPDALHVACAQHHGCEALWTADDRLRAVGDLVRRI